MWGWTGDWFVIGALYVVGMGFFRLVGGVGAAASAVQRWGRAESARRRKRLGV